jgi:hypothetical protein
MFPPYRLEFVLPYPGVVRFSRQRTVDSDRTPGADETVDDTAAEVGNNRAYTPGKGRPTPKRREAERRRGPAPAPPRTQREAMKRSRLNKEDRRQAAADRRAGMAAGEERHLLPRDKGPVKAFVRDLVDSRRRLIGLFMPLAVLVLIATIAPLPIVQLYAPVVTLAIVAVMLVDGVLLGRNVVRQVRQRFPDAKDGGLTLGWYAFSRGMQIRKLRLPKPRIKPGESF